MRRRGERAEVGLPARFLTLLVRAYQVVLSPVMGGACRFEPTCSNYMIEALRVHGAVKGTLLGLWRILRCHPFGAYGYDPVPPPGKWKNGLESLNRKSGV
ncbi:MAG: membrane protein insertion efficiency factor YidD [Kiritimatiellae bacterium]|nr:membrane protein insertion efficiency factor YidD [Kiritimatiellia bacterium]